ncbi:MAG: AAA family ATPase [Gammaproteobacteria bacterium]|nr:AAA family ATPase [Gammaproteobacteria bacterium]
MDRNPTDMANEVFPAEPDRIALYPAAGQQRVIAALRQDVTAGRHLLCITGPAGSGKTVLLRALRQSFKQGLVGLVEHPTPGRLLVDMANALHLDATDGNEPLLRRRIVMMLSMADQSHQSIVQIVDAADTLPIEDLNLLLHFFPPGHATVILAGSAAPETWLAGCSTSVGVAHIDDCYRLEPLSEEETAEYIRHRLRVAGLPDDVFQPAVLATIHQRSGGLPGRINQCSAEMLAHAGVQGIARIAKPVPVPTPLPRTSPDETFSDKIAITPIRERRRAVLPAQSFVAPREAHYAAEPPPGRARRLRRSVQVWRALAILSGIALVIVSTQDAWIEYLPSKRAVSSDFAELFVEPATPLENSGRPERPTRKLVQPKASDGPAAPAETPNAARRSSDFAALHTAPLQNAEPEMPLLPDAKDSATPLPKSTTVAPTTVEPERNSKSDTAANAPSDAPSDAPGDDQKPGAKTDRADADKDSVKPRSARATVSTRPHRPEIARLYAVRAEYEWRNGELGAAAVSIQRGLANDPGNPRLLEMRALLQQVIQEP